MSQIVSNFIHNASPLQLLVTAGAAATITSSLFIKFVLGRRSYKVHKTGIVVCTGASSGIGRHFVEYLARRTSYVVLAGVRKDVDADKIRQIGLKNLMPLKVDVTSHDSCVKAVKEIERIGKDLNIPMVALVNNAGSSRYLPIEFQDVDDARNLFEVNFFGLMDLTKLCIPLLRESKGRLVNISSIAGIFAPPCQGLYCATKFAVEAMSDSLRRELYHFGISVSIVEPAYVKTSILETTRAASELKDEKADGDLKRLYDVFFSEEARAKKIEEVQCGSEPIVVSEAIEDAIRSSKPRVRYTVANALKGVSAYWLTWLFWGLPERVMDRVVGC